MVVLEGPRSEDPQVDGVPLVTLDLAGRRPLVAHRVECIHMVLWVVLWAGQWEVLRWVDRWVAQWVADRPIHTGTATMVPILVRKMLSSKRTTRKILPKTLAVPSK